MANLLYQSIHYVMWIGLGLCCILLFPYPRFLRKPLVSGLEKILTNWYMRHVQVYLLLFVGLVWLNSFYQMRQHTTQLIQHKAEKMAAAMGANLMELEKTINQTRMHLFLDQRNAYLSLFVLMLFFIVYTYMNSLKRDDELHDELMRLQKLQKEKLKPLLEMTPTPGEPAKKKLD